MTKKLRMITAEDLYQFDVINGVRLAPDGKHVVWAQQRVDRKTEKKFNNLWVASVSTGDVKQFTMGDQNDSSPKWSPDSREIAFLSNRKDKENPPGIYLISLNGGEARHLADLPAIIKSYDWSPDGKTLLCAALGLDEEQIERQKDEQKKKLGVVARHYDRLFYKFDGFGYLPRERTHLWTIDVKNGKAKKLTDHKIHDQNMPVWSPDGKWIVYVSNISDDPDMFPDRDDLFILPGKGGDAKKVETPVGPKMLPSFSPDGKMLAYIGTAHENEWYRNNSLWIVPVNNSAPARDVLTGTDIHVDSSTINDVGTPETMAPVWSKDGQSIYFQAVKHGCTNLLKVDLATGKIQEVIVEDGVVVSFNFDSLQEKIGYYFGKLDDPAQVVVRDVISGKSKTITNLNSWLKDVDLGTIEEVWFKGPANNDLQGWILKPPGFDEKKKYPSIMEIHGGPLTQYGKFFMHEFYYLASKGYIVYFSNPRGGRGYGEEHAGAIWGGWGDADYADLMAWADFIEKKPFIDKKRMGVTGGSYGGYMTVWIIGHTQRFKAAVTQRCVSNFVSMWGSSDMNWNFQHVLGDVAPYEDLQKHWKHSPIAYIANAKTPTLVIHNEFDLRCPIEQGEQVFVALKRLGVDSEFVRFPDEFHGLSRGGRTDRRIARLNHILRWFDNHL